MPPYQVGNDRGPQYRHGIYATSAEQLKTATESRKIAQKAFPSNEVMTEAEMAAVFWCVFIQSTTAREMYLPVAMLPLY
jgi:peptide methionine sulfoxide reductase MsrA